MQCTTGQSKDLSGRKAGIRPRLRIARLSAAFMIVTDFFEVQTAGSGMGKTIKRIGVVIGPPAPRLNL